MKNKFVSDTLYEIADLLDIKGENFFITRAYRMAAQKIEVLDEDIKLVVKEKRVEEIPGIGQGLGKKIIELVETGELKYLKDLKKELPEGLLNMLKIPGLGPKKVAAIFNKLSIKSIPKLLEACKKGKLRDLEGFGITTELNILRGINLINKTSGRVLLHLAFEDGNNYLNFLKKSSDIQRLNIAGSLRRRKETIGDLDILASSKNPKKVMDYFVSYPQVKRVLLKGLTKTSVLLNDDLQVDLRVVDDNSFGAALQYFTGSKEHNVKMRSLAIKKGFKLNEYGLFKKTDNDLITGKNEEDIYKKLGLRYIEPELRENRGEITASLNNNLPDLIDLKDIKGDIHIHSNYSDGFEKIKDLADTCEKMGYEYIGIADHSQSLKVAHGLTEERIRKKINEINKINKKYSNFHILCGTECDILADGSLDYNNKTLKMFDYVGIGIHTNFKMKDNEINNRILNALDNEYVTFIAHPTCRMIGHREPFNLDIEKLIEKTIQTNTYLEINSFPDRLDLNDINTKIAKEKGAKFVINTDSHHIKNLKYIKYGVASARRGWLEKKDVLNTCSYNELLKKLG